MVAIRLRDPSILSPDRPIYKHTHQTLQCYMGVYNAELMFQARISAVQVRASWSAHPAVDIATQSASINEQVRGAFSMLPFLGFEAPEEASELKDEYGRPISSSDAALLDRYAQLHKEGVIK